MLPGAEGERPAMPFTQGIALGQNQDGRLELVTTVDTGSADLHGSGSVWHVREAREDPGWPPQWGSLDVPLESGFGGPAPAITRNKHGRLEIAVTTADALLHIWQTKPNGDEWHHDLLALPRDQAMTRVSPALAENKDGRIEAFVLANDDRAPHKEDGLLWNIRQDPTAPGGWSPWSDLATPGHLIRHRLAVAPNVDGRLDVFVQSDSSTKYHIRQDPTAPDGWLWAELGTPQVALKGQPVVARNKDGRLEAFMLGTDGAVWHIWQDLAAPGGWSPPRWHSLGGRADRSPGWPPARMPTGGWWCSPSPTRPTAPPRTRPTLSGSGSRRWPVAGLPGGRSPVQTAPRR
jgi:hypothetical protein